LSGAVPLSPLRAKNRKSKHKLMPHAMTEYIVESLQHLTMAAAGVYTPTKAEMRTWGLLLDFTRQVHEIFQPAKDEQKGKDTTPIRPVFRTVQPALPAEATPTPTTAPAESARPLEVDGQLYE